MRKLAATLLLIALSVSAYAQQKAIDSLKKLILTAKDDTSKAILYRKLGNLYLYSRPDSDLLLQQRGIQLSQKANYLQGVAKALNDEGIVFSVTGNYPKALNAFLPALRINEQSNDPLLIAVNLSNIGLVYADEGDYRQCIVYNLRAKAIDEAIHSERPLTNDLLDLGDSYEKLNILDTALLYTRQAYQHALKLKDADNIGIATNNLGNIYAKLDKPLTALDYYRKAMPFEKQADNDDAKCETTLGMAKIFMKLGQPDSGLYYARQSIAAGRHGGFTAQVLAASQFLTEYFEKQGRLDSAFRYQKMSITAKDSLFSQEKTKAVQNLSFAERQRQQDIQERDAAYKANLRFYIMAVVIASLFVLAIVFWRNNRQKQKANHLLREQKEEIASQRDDLGRTLEELKVTQNQLVQREKMASLGELTAGIAHEIQNPLNFVNNFSEVNEEMLEELKAESTKPKAERDGQLESELINDLIDNQRKIKHHGKRADFIVKGMLEHSRTSTGERQLTNINVLADEFLKLSYHGLKAKDKDFEAELITNFDNSLPRMNIVQQDIGRVLVNLYNNAFYAVNQKAKTAGPDYKPFVEVSTATENGSILVKVKDNGNGIPDAIKDKIMQPFFTTKPTGEATGLGLSLSYDIVVKGHGGSISVDTKEGESTEFAVRLAL
jgi:two-component system NtrC family sensor kinase